MNRLYLIDANGVAHWQHYSGISKDENLITGVDRWMQDFIRKYAPTDVIACFDCSRESNWRRKKFSSYKSARDSKPKDESLVCGLRDLPRLFERFNVEPIFADGFEADDLIATLSNNHAGEVIVITSDKDMMQLVDDRVKVYDPRPTNSEFVFYDSDKVHGKFGVYPHRIREFLAIAGDSADSIPGIRGWGKMTAIEAISQTKSVDELIRKIGEISLQGISAKKQNVFLQSMEDFAIFYEIVGLRFDVETGNKNKGTPINELLPS